MEQETNEQKAIQKLSGSTLPKITSDFNLIRNTQQAITCGMPTLNKIAVVKGEKYLIALTDSMIYEIAEIIGIKLSKPILTDFYMECRKYGYLNPADFKILLDRCKQTKFYNKDYQELLQVFYAYIDERLNEAEKLSIKEASEYKAKVDRVSGQEKTDHDYKAFRDIYTKIDKKAANKLGESLKNNTKK